MTNSPKLPNTPYNLEHILAQKMSRQQFLVAIGGVIVSMVGIKSFFESLSAYEKRKKTNHEIPAGAYGGSSYAAKTTSSASGRHL